MPSVAAGGETVIWYFGLTWRLLSLPDAAINRAPDATFALAVM